MIIADTFYGYEYGITPKDSIEGDTILYTGNGYVKSIMIFGASSLNTDDTNIVVSKVEYSNDGIAWVEEESYIDGLVFTLYKNVVGVVNGDPQELIAVTIDVNDYSYGSESKLFRKITFSLDIFTNDENDSVSVQPTITQKGCPGAVIITWLDYDLSILGTTTVPVGETPVYPGYPTRHGDCQYDYTFAGWDPAVVPATVDMYYTAVYTPTEHYHNVIWVNWDGTWLNDAVAICNEDLRYSGATPTREPSGGIQYTFAGWSPVEEPITADTIYTAQYTESPMQYEIRFVNDGGALLYSIFVSYGEMPVYPGTTPPEKAPIECCVFTFNGWDHVITAATRNDTYIATYIHSPRWYTITWVNYDGTVLETDTNVKFGTTPTYDGQEPTKGQDFIFTGWTPAIVQVTGDTTYTAAFVRPTYTVTVKNYSLLDNFGGTFYAGDTPGVTKLHLHKNDTYVIHATPYNGYKVLGDTKQSPLSVVTIDVDIMDSYTSTSYTCTGDTTHYVIFAKKIKFNLSLHKERGADGEYSHLRTLSNGDIGTTQWYNDAWHLAPGAFGASMGLDRTSYITVVRNDYLTPMALSSTEPRSSVKISAVAEPSSEEIIESFLVRDDDNNIILSTASPYMIEDSFDNLSSEYTIEAVFVKPVQLCIVSFDMQGHGDAIDDKRVAAGQPVQKPDDPTAEGYEFLGWYTSTAYTTEWNFDNAVGSNMTLFAKWNVITE